MARLVTSDLSLNYQVMGDGETVVLIHGLGANMAFWYMGIARILARNYNVISYDLRGHGRSGVPKSGYDLPAMSRDLEALLGHLNVERTHLVGHSHGARIALHYSLTYPNRAQSLTLADTQLSCIQPRMRLSEWSYWPTWKKQLQEMGRVSLPQDDEFISHRLLVNFNHIANGQTNEALGAGPQKPSLRRRDMGNRGSARWEKLLQTTSAQKDFDDDRPVTVKKLQRLEVPTLASFGEYSHCLPSCDRLAQLLQNCETDIAPKVGHFHPAIKPRRFVRVLNQFLRTNAGTPVRRTGRPLRNANRLRRIE